jgi:hypothetical protein
MLSTYRRRGASRHLPFGLFLCTTLIRSNITGDLADFDVVVSFDVTSFTPGSPQTWLQPADPPEAGFVVTGISFDPPTPPDDSPWPLTAAERASLTGWFEANYDRAMEAALDAMQGQECGERSEPVRSTGE